MNKSFARSPLWSSLLWLSLLFTALLAQPLDAAVREQRGNLILDGIPAHSPSVLARFDAWDNARSASFGDFLPDGSILITTRFAEVEQVHRIRVPLGAREQLTFDAEPVAGVLANPANSPGSFLFGRDSGGNENTQLHLFRLAERSSQRLTDGRSRYGSALWSRDGRRLVFQSNARNGIQQDVYSLDVDRGGPAQLLLASTGQTWQPLDWSPDGRTLLLLDYVSVTEAYLHLFDLSSQTLTRIPLPTGKQKTSAVGAARFAADGRGVWVVADLGGEFRQLHYVDLSSGTPTVRAAIAQYNGDIEDLEVSAAGRYLAYVVNIEGYSKLVVRDLGRAADIVANDLPNGIISQLRFDASGTKLGMSISSARSPRDVWTFEPGEGRSTRWTMSELGEIDPAQLVDAELIRYPTWDRLGREPRKIPAFLYKPKSSSATRNGKHPVVIDIHGGPEAQSRPGFSSFTQYLVNELGYVVVQPNVRGSTGYGRSYTQLDNGRLREDAVRDIGALLVWIAANPELDAERVVVMGGSYGGYMTLAALIMYGERLRGGIDVVGISNFVTFLNNTSAYRRDLRRVEYGDERDPSMRAFLQRISPLNRANMIRKPLLVVQGQNDPRVPASESEQLVARVRGSGGEVWYLVALDEGHGFRKKANRNFYLKTAATFLERLRD
jgi:dipeptidyl aminopeptidase/acylaminoacyl peptidase